MIRNPYQIKMFKHIFDKLLTLVSNYLFRRNTSVNGISVGKVVGQSNSERFSLVLVNGTDKRGVVHKSFQIGHHLVARIGIAVFVVVPELTKTY